MRTSRFLMWNLVGISAVAGSSSEADEAEVELAAEVEVEVEAGVDEAERPFRNRWRCSIRGMESGNEPLQGKKNG